MSATVLVTGAAGFIGHYVSQRLLERGVTVVGLDNLNDYYDVRLKEARLARMTGGAHKDRFRHARISLEDRAAMDDLFRRERFDSIIHLAAQAGVRYSLTHPHAYVDANLAGFMTILEGARAQQVRHLVYASSSSVYGANTKLPFSVQDPVERPISLYAATKRANELMAYVYATQFKVPATGLRFFTVYGPWGRPDMAAFKFIRAILAGEPIEVYNHGDMQRDFTYVDDIVEGVLRVHERAPAADADGVRHKVYNIGNHKSEPLMRFIELLSQAIGRTPEMKLLPMQPGDVKATYADTDDLRREFDWAPSTPIDVGLPRLVQWYLDFYGGKPGPKSA
ncbi:MAG: NAD-dependent epimerase/dehydratase family protein [Burkholderiaceae bacterium]|jgi:UDP-glucuronate 4-epimerase|nr:NAD-dependent epimerase/dehydratase family protein [Burkholderiaceae bacterium]